MEAQAVIHNAVALGLLPAGTTLPEDDSRPWPVLLLIALGAWLAALPLLAVVGLLLGEWVTEGPGTYFVGALLLAGALVTLRSQPLPVFVEQIALPALLVGGGAVVAGFFRDTSHDTAAALSCGFVMAVALATPRSWLRVLLGALAAVLFVLAWGPRPALLFGYAESQAIGFSLHAALVVWLLALVAQSRGSAAARRLIEPLQAGWVLALLAGLAGWSGLPMLAGGTLQGLMGWWAPGNRLPLQPATSVLLALAGALLAAWRWPSLRKPWCALAALPLLGLAGFMPALGVTLLVLALCATSSRWHLAAAAGVAAAWIGGAFYYLLAWPLQDKALLLLATGVLSGGLAWWVLRPSPVATAALPRHGAWGIALSVVALLAVINVGIWQKEQLIRHGQVLLVDLRPVDPRSLMQGDYMALAFSLPSGVDGIDGIDEPAPRLWATQRPRVLARRDERGVAQLRIPDPAQPRQAGEIEVELTLKGGRWTLVTDAWFFAEGEGQRWAAARYGEFRVDAQGRALLVGLRNAQLQRL